MSDAIDYGNLMHRAMRSLIHDVLTDVQANGLPGDHHFFITFDTTHPDAAIAPWLADRYPGEMTVVMQHWYDGLDVTTEGFHVTLNFGDAPEPLYIPFAAIKTFVDPSVEFGLRFENAEDTASELSVVQEQTAPETPKPADAPNAKEAGPADVVSLDSFRKT
ncbi:SspB family protein [Pseudaestuariivita sp.]|uniref:SspB family protein n=1 Tax=Pseudaestuariivita sp. TaxID=2211669 RepID=UPI004058B7BB